MPEEAITCPGCKSKILLKDFDAHVKSDHQDFIIPAAPTNPAISTPEGVRGMNGREQLGHVIKYYPKAAIALFIFGCAFTFFALAWRW